MRRSWAPRTKVTPWASLTLACLVALAACGRAVERSRAPSPSPEVSAARAAPSGPVADAPGEYLGRKLAPPMSYLGAEWLERPEREVEEKPEHVLDVLAIAPGSVVADVGAGSGYFTERLSRRVGPTGKVIATDLQPEMLALVKKRMGTKGLSNIEPRLATETDASLPEGAVDLVLMVDVYHELPRPKETLAQVKRALRKNGRLALVEYRAEDPNVPIKKEHEMTLPQIEAELGASGFGVRQVDESLPWQRIVIATPGP